MNVRETMIVLDSWLVTMANVPILAHPFLVVQMPTVCQKTTPLGVDARVDSKKIVKANVCHFVTVLPVVKMHSVSFHLMDQLAFVWKAASVILILEEVVPQLDVQSTPHALNLVTFVTKAIVFLLAEVEVVDSMLIVTLFRKLVFAQMDSSVIPI